MDFNSFSMNMDRLKRVFGDRHYPEERAKIIWEDVKNLPSQWMMSVISEFIGSHRQPPLIPEFRDQISKKRQQENSQHKYEEIKIEDLNKPLICNFCEDDGIILAKHKVNLNSYSFRCYCAKGKSDTRHYPVFEWEKEYLKC